MKKIYCFVVLVSLLLSACQTQKKEDKTKESSPVKKSYFGQKPPGTKAELFAPGTISVNGRYEYAVSFTPEIDELYFSGEGEDEIQHVYFSKLNNNKWTKPAVANFTKGLKKNEFEAFASPSGDKIFFAAYDSIFSDESIWYVDRLEGSWSEAKKLDASFNEDIVFYPTIAENEDLFYTSISQGKMFYASSENGIYSTAKEMEIAYGIHGFISPKQDFILIDAKKENDKNKDRDIHVCFKKKNGTWSQPINLGKEVNSDFTETCPSLTPDGKYLFFSRYNEEGGMSNIYWVSAEVIHKLNPEQVGK